ncbi:hypothetical protein [Nostoc sp.]|uniref:hypothetical protein n=1 Tax=Nostoc sp. TaxID=1180 RepID=UPI002FF9F344
MPSISTSLDGAEAEVSRSIGNWALGTCTEFRHFDYAQCIATLNYRVRVASRREVVGAASPRVVLGIGHWFFSPACFPYSLISLRLWNLSILR